MHFQDKLVIVLIYKVNFRYCNITNDIINTETYIQSTYIHTFIHTQTHAVNHQHNNKFENNPSTHLLNNEIESDRSQQQTKNLSTWYDYTNSFAHCH